MKHETVQRVATPTAFLVGLPSELADICIEVLDEGGLRVLKIGHIAGASERIPVVMPQLVVVATTMRADELELLRDRCVAVGAEILPLAPDVARAELVATMKAAAKNALIRVLRGGG